MQTLYTVPDKETGGIRTELHVTTYTDSGLYLVVYISDEWGTHKKTIRRSFANKVDVLYHKNLRAKVKKMGGIVHTRISSTPLSKTKKKVIIKYNKRDKLGRFVK